MIELPKEVVKELVDELKVLLVKKENQLDEEELERLNKANEVYGLKIKEKKKEITKLEEEVKDLESNLVDIPDQKDRVDESRIEGLVNMLILSGYYKKIVKSDGEYLEETGIYEFGIEYIDEVGEE